MNKKGVITVEAILALGVLLSVILVLTSLFQYMAFQDQVSQIGHDTLKDIEIVNFAYHVIEPSDWLPVEKVIPEKLNGFIEPYLQPIISFASEKVLTEAFESYFEISYTAYDIDTEVSVELNAHHIHVEINYDYVLPFLIDVKDCLVIDSQLYMYGVDGHNPKTIDAFSGSDKQYVYVTKSGHKYHTKDCFYINRSTTDHSKVRKISLKEAMKSYQPCRRCILKEANPWN